MEETCRVCMDRSGALTNIFDETHTWDTCIADMIAQCTGYEVRRGDLLSENICPPCLEDAVNAFNLIKTYEQSHQIYFPVVEKDIEDSCCDNLNGEVWEPSDSETEQSIPFETDVKIHKNEADKTDYLERPYKCPDCPKTFKKKYQHTRHIRTHTEERPHKCTLCSKSFKRKDKLKLHVWTHTGERPFKCTDCSKSFISQCELTVHMRIHTGEQPYQCDHCLKSFQRQSNLKRHSRIHTGERPHLCIHCSKSFKQKHHLSEHILTHAEEKLYTCSYCTKNFRQKSSLGKHTRNHVIQMDASQFQITFKDEIEDTDNVRSPRAHTRHE
ncbi:zinc finger protein 501-like [Drosophila miranda]|uniref:zinc finger protein 501-like n=1 Tax=Drosophila miranda TaxID=7229 RepID=UPI00143FAEAB|nr:zinc finger protein 501-like [Drosophila miranda]